MVELQYGFVRAKNFVDFATDALHGDVGVAVHFDDFAGGRWRDEIEAGARVEQKEFVGHFEDRRWNQQIVTEAENRGVGPHLRSNIAILRARLRARASFSWLIGGIGGTTPSPWRKSVSRAPRGSLSESPLRWG